MATVGGETAPTSVVSRRADRAPRRSWRTWFIGRPLPTADAENETVGKTVGLAIFASDALSSTAYATQEILLVLAIAGAAAFSLAVPIAVAIVALLAIVTFSYHQTIHAYPGGGGAYIVARDNLGEFPAQIAGASLLMDYILTVSVSVSSAVAQIASAFPSMHDRKVTLAIIFVMFIMVANLRGVRESGRAFAIPTYAFLTLMTITVGVGLFRLVTGTLGTVVDPPPLDVHGALAPISLFLVLHAFSNGTTALTGVEAISNGITAFRRPRSHNAAVTLLWMSAILGSLFFVITLLAQRIGAVPSEIETVISQLARTALGGRGVLHLAVLAGTTLILVMAANTAFNGFPRLAALQAADGFLPKQLAYRGSRLVYSRGIIVLSLAACALIAAFDASVTGLIPLYAIGVFASFTLSQAGMTRRWLRIGRLGTGGAAVVRGSSLVFDRRWRGKLLVNGFGAICTAIVVVVFTITKFHDGAWLVVVVIPVLVFAFFAIRRHYDENARELSLDSYGAPPRVSRHRVILPVSSLHRGVVEALRYARSLSHDITAVHVSSDPESNEALRKSWDRWGDGVRLVILDSPYRLLLEPLLDYIETVASRCLPNETITIVVPQFVPRRRWHNLLHAQTAAFLRMALMFRRGIVITSVPYQIRRSPDDGRMDA